MVVHHRLHQPAARIKLPPPHIGGGDMQGPPLGAQLLAELLHQGRPQALALCPGGHKELVQMALGPVQHHEGPHGVALLHQHGGGARRAKLGIHPRRPMGQWRHRAHRRVGAGPGIAPQGRELGEVLRGGGAQRECVRQAAHARIVRGSPNSGRSHPTRCTTAVTPQHSATVPPTSSTGSTTGPRCQGAKTTTSPTITVWCSTYQG